jgi:hypothetical protein
VIVVRARRYQAAWQLFSSASSAGKTALSLLVGRLMVFSLGAELQAIAITKRLPELMDKDVAACSTIGFEGGLPEGHCSLSYQRFMHPLRLCGVSPASYSYG